MNVFDMPFSKEIPFPEMSWNAMQKRHERRDCA